MHFHRIRAGRSLRLPSRPAGGQAALLLPPDLESRAFAPAWALALAAHVALTGVVLMGPSPRPPEAPPIRLVFVEPPPPPPSPLGTAAGTAPTPAPPETPAVSEIRREVPQPVPSEPGRLRRTAPGSKPRTRGAAKPRPTPPPAPPTVGAPAGAIAGEAGGLVGGVTGGIAGGVVAGTGTAPVPVSQVAHPPQVIHRVRPIYPPEARRKDVEGLVVLEAVLDREGRVEPGIKVIKSVPPLDAEAVAAIRQWRFRPARNAAGEPLRVILEIPIRFVLT